ncbi:hypothetical protein Anapl_17544 [Anas platyrhynchos]|uniref:Uncharacterized protein n=1 Tax=Anas platyrhynchos TaxID=8839 RepID=R0JI11_ANAPL|nr:hypothetical protein Anapl_17544 [Anas platyrhynchos]
MPANFTTCSCTVGDTLGPGDRMLAVAVSQGEPVVQPALAAIKGPQQASLAEEQPASALDMDTSPRHDNILQERSLDSMAT